MSERSSIHTKRNDEKVVFLTVKIEKLVVGIFRVSGVWHVGWWSFFTSVRLQVDNNRNDHIFKYFLGVNVRLKKVCFTVNEGNNLGIFGYCLLNSGCPLNTVSALYRFHCRHKISSSYNTTTSVLKQILTESWLVSTQCKVSI